MRYRPQKRQQTIRKIFRFSFLQGQIVDPPIGRIVLRLPVELLEKVGTNNRQLAFVLRGRAAHGTRERKSENQERGKGEIARSTHGDVDLCGV